QTFMTLIPEADRNQVKDHFKTISREHPVETHEHRVLAPDGELHWQRWTNRAIYDDDGVLIEYLSVGRDITERKRAEQALEASEALYRSTIDSMSDLIHVVDANLRLTLVNNTFREWSGKLGLPAYAVGLNVFDVFPFLNDTVRREYEQVFRTGEMLMTEETHTVGGRSIATETRKIPVTERGATVRVVTIVRDITERRKAQEALQYRLDFEHLIMSLSSRFISVPLDHIDDNIVNALSAVGLFTQADRCYVFLLSDDRTTMDNTHEWCAEGIASHIDQLKNLPTEAFDYSLRTMLKGEAFHIPRVADLPDEAAAEKAEFERENIQSVLCVPMMRRGKIIGFVGFDSERKEKVWTVDEIGLLKVVGEMLSTALERQQVEQELRDSEQRFRTVADFTYDWEYWLGADGKCVYVTPSCETTTGYTAQEFAQDFGILRRIVHNDDLPVLDRHLQDENEPGRVTSIDFRITTRGGEERWINHVCQPVFADDGTYLGRRASNHDITERKYAEEALRHERDKAQTYLDVAGTMLMALDTDERVVLVNRRGCELLGYDEDRIVGTNWFDNYVPERHRGPVRSLYHKMINGGEFKADYFENQVVTADGEEKMMAWYNTVLYDDLGRIKGTLSSGLDITESRRIQKVQAALFEISEATNLSQNLEELLKTIHRILGTLIDTTNFYVALYDKDNDSYTFPYIVDQYEQQLPSSPEQLKKTLTDYVRRTGLPLLADGKVDRQLEAEGEVAVVGQPSEIWLGVPLKIADGVIGVVAVQSYTDPNLYKESDMDLMTFVSGHITMAIQRKLADDALGESEKLHRSLVETMSEGLVVLDHEGRVTFANKKLCELLGVSRNEITGSTLREYLDNENWSLVQQQLQDCQKGAHESYEIQWLRGDEGEVTTIVSPEAVSDADGRTIGSFAVITDISEWKRAEDKLRQASALLRTEREALTQKNIALKEILDHIEKERQDYKQGICQDVRSA
ncbi:MAG: PAS domain S-box protein, partial [Candidatus Zixiibacteriota bacterium]